MPTLSHHLPHLPPQPARLDALPLPARVQPEAEASFGDHVENAVFGGLDSVFSGLSSLGLVRPTVEAGLKLVASGNDNAWSVSYTHLTLPTIYSV